MKAAAYYNEIDPYAAQWLRNLISAGHIAPGDVDERSIEDVKPDDLRNYTQCHFFAGIGVWSYALRNAGWPDDRPVWTGSCPCQPFSAAGKGDGFDDERHLWPAFAWLIRERKPKRILGEQVASGDANTWFDLVQANVENMDYAFGLVPFPSAGVGAPHIRDRAYWCARRLSDANGELGNGGGNIWTPGRDEHPDSGSAGSLANYQRPGLESSSEECRRSHKFAQQTSGDVAARGVASRLANSIIGQQRQIGESGSRIEHDKPAREKEPAEVTGFCGDRRALQVNGFWRDADWIFCRDGKWRPVEPGTFPLADGITSRVGRLRAYGNAINAEAAKAFITAYMGCE